MTAIRNFVLGAAVVLTLSLAGASQLRADDISYVYQFGGNTFTWELPTNPVILPGDVYLGTGFTIENVAFTENGANLTGTIDFFSTTSGGGFDLWNGYYFYFCNAFGPQLYTGSEDAPTLLMGDFPLTDYGNNFNADAVGTTTSLNVTTVPEPSALSLLAMGLAFGLAIFAFKKS